MSILSNNSQASHPAGHSQMGGVRQYSKNILTWVKDWSATLATSALVLGATALPSQAFTSPFPFLQKTAQFTQNSNAQPTIADGYFFDSVLQFGEIGDVDGVSTTYFYETESGFIEDGIFSPITDYQFISNPFTTQPQARASFFFLTEEEMNQAFPNGAIYESIYSTPTGDDFVAVKDAPSNFFPLQIPSLTSNTFSNLQSLDPSQPFVFNFDSFSPPENPAITANISLSIVPQLGNSNSFVVSGLSPDTTGVVLGGNTLSPDTTYTFNLFYNVFYSAFDEVDFLPIETSFFKATTGTFTTGAIGSTIPGATPANPLLPVITPGSPSFVFPQVNIIPDGLGIVSPIFFDPDIAVGYDYTVTGDANFASVLIPEPLPQGDDQFVLELPGFGSFDLSAGVTFDLIDINPLGFDFLTISGIDAGEALDPTDPLAFITGFTFTGPGIVDVTQTPIIANVPDLVTTPEPSGLVALLMVGAGGLLVSQGKKRSYSGYIFKS
ncbi:hypothetical protein [Nodularia chucula]|uniref:hypothetical protein n=1 Tax=Nodularia chucula TaxID=3093667 RepID=UPI0039C5DF75